LKRANQALSQKYRVEGFPTVMLMDGNEKILHRESGYSGNSAAAYVANLKTKVSQ
jgi:thioredoxin-related protein